MIQVKKLTPDMWEDYIEFFENRAFADGNINKGCYCVWHHWTVQHEQARSLLPGNEQKRAKKEFAAELVRAGKLNGFAAYASGKMIGFCNADKKANYFRLHPDKIPEIWAAGEDGSKTLSIVCFTVAPEMRGLGVATALLRAACGYAEENGFERIESYPSDKAFSQDHCCGNVSMYQKLGFAVHPAGDGIVARKWCSAHMKLTYGTETDIESWMRLVTRVRWNFPGLETDTELTAHRNTVLRFMGERQALCVKAEGEIAGVLLFSKTHNMICCLAVAPEHRRRGIAAMLLTETLDNLDRTKDITVSTFRAEDEKGTAPRTLYQRFGFVPGELVEEFGYPNQVFILHPQN